MGKWEIFRRLDKDTWTILLNDCYVGSASTLKLAKRYAEDMATGNLFILSEFDRMAGGTPARNAQWICGTACEATR